MSDIELVIKIDEEAKQAFDCAESNDLKGCYYDHGGVVGNAIKNGVPLPKGHGRLIDANVLKKDDEVTEWLSLNAVRTGKMLKRFSELFIKKIDVAPTIIEADKAESEDEEQIKVGTKVRTIKDKDFAGEEVFPVGTIGIVEEIREDERLPYIIRANHDYWYYSRDMFEVIEDIEPQESEGTV